MLWNGQFWSKKTGCGRPPRHLYFKNVYGSPDYNMINLHYKKKKKFTKKNIQGMLNMVYILSEKIDSPDSGHVAKKSKFFKALPKSRNFLKSSLKVQFFGTGRFIYAFPNEK